jgi:hypothetical protein
MLSAGAKITSLPGVELIAASPDSLPHPQNSQATHATGRASLLLNKPAQPRAFPAGLNFVSGFGVAQEQVFPYPESYGSTFRR